MSTSGCASMGLLLPPITNLGAGPLSQTTRTNLRLFSDPEASGNSLGNDRQFRYGDICDDGDPCGADAEELLPLQWHPGPNSGSPTDFQSRASPTPATTARTPASQRTSCFSSRKHCRHSCHGIGRTSRKCLLHSIRRGGPAADHIYAARGLLAAFTGQATADGPGGAVCHGFLCPIPGTGIRVGRCDNYDGSSSSSSGTIAVAINTALPHDGHDVVFRLGKCTQHAV